LVINKRWIIIAIIGAIMIFTTIFFPFVTYGTSGNNYTFVNFIGNWNSVDIVQQEIIDNGDYHDLEANFFLAGPILLILGISIMIIGSVVLIFDVKAKWGSILRGVTFLGSSLGFLGEMFYTFFAFIVVQNIYEITQTLILNTLALLLISLIIGASSISKIFKNREKRLMNMES